MILLHGFTDNGLCWARVASMLENDFDIIMPDIRGHGKSIAKEIDFSLETISEEINQLTFARKTNPDGAFNGWTDSNINRCKPSRIDL